MDNIGMKNILDIVFPRSCTICSKEGTYLCERCKKLFKRSLPECYICRRLSNDFQSHSSCMRNYSLTSVFVCWEYNSLTSTILKRYKYSYVYDISESLVELFLDIMRNSQHIKILGNTLVTIVPISSSRMRERGFNQVFNLGKIFANYYSFDFCDSLILKTKESGHQAFEDRKGRRNISFNHFSLNTNFNMDSYDSITIIDDVLTTGATLESITKCIRKSTNRNIPIHAICLFRGKAFYSSDVLDSSDPLASPSLESSS